MDATVEAVKTSETMKEVAVSDKSRLVALLLCFFFGWAGGGFGLWWFLDLVMIATGNFRDKNEHTISQWTK
jgi:hypothetical protein